ncbi:MAG: Fpg/Nei family DNA glycosylase [Spirochaetota bacterium]
MPELPDLEGYRVALDRALRGHVLEEVAVYHPFLLRSAGTPPESAIGRTVLRTHRRGKRIAIEFDGGPVFVFHLMIAGRFRWKDSTESGPAKPPARKSGTLARLVFENGSLSLTEAGTRRRASLHVVLDIDDLRALDPGGSELLDGQMDAETFATLLRSENHTLKRSLTDPRLFSGIGNAYSDEILFAARMSPFAMTQSLSDAECARLFVAAVRTLGEWRDRFVAEASERFPAKVTAFRPEMHVHGKYDTPCSVCGTPIQRIRYADNESNYCPTCQTGGKVYADRALSRLLKSDWPRTVEELEKLKRPPTSR